MNKQRSLNAAGDGEMRSNPVLEGDTAIVKGIPDKRDCPTVRCN